MQAKKKRTADKAKRGEVLVAIMKDKGDFAILQEEQWYRIPVESAPKRWPPQWLAFYQTKKFEEDACAVNYFGRVSDIEVVKRRELFLNEIASAKSEQIRFRHIKESLADYCVPKIADAINRLDGLSDEGLVSRKFRNLPGGVAQQLSLFASTADYDTEEELD